MADTMMKTIRPNASENDYTAPFLSEDAEFQSTIEKMRKTILSPKEKLGWGYSNPTPRLYILRSGILKLKVSWGVTEVIELLYPGATFGGLTHLASHDTEFEVTALESCVVCEVDSNELAELQRCNSKFIDHYHVAMSLYASSLRGEFGMLAQLNVKTRLARSLAKDFCRRGQNVDGKLQVSKILSQDDWAKLLRSRRETVSRAFSELEREGVFRDEGRFLRLLDENALMQIVASAS